MSLANEVRRLRAVLDPDDPEAERGVIVSLGPDGWPETMPATGGIRLPVLALEASEYTPDLSTLAAPVRAVVEELLRDPEGSAGAQVLVKGPEVDGLFGMRMGGP